MVIDLLTGLKDYGVTTASEFFFDIFGEEQTEHWQDRIDAEHDWRTWLTGQYFNIVGDQRRLQPAERTTRALSPADHSTLMFTSTSKRSSIWRHQRVARPADDQAYPDDVEMMIDLPRPWSALSRLLQMVKISCGGSHKCCSYSEF